MSRNKNTTPHTDKFKHPLKGLEVFEENGTKAIAGDHGQWMTEKDGIELRVKPNGQYFIKSGYGASTEYSRCFFPTVHENGEIGINLTKYGEVLSKRGNHKKYKEDHFWATEVAEYLNDALYLFESLAKKHAWLWEPLTIQEAADIAGVTPVTMTRHIRRGNIQAGKKSSGWVVKRKDLFKLMESDRYMNP